MNKAVSLIRLGDENFFENPWETFLTEIICTSLGSSSSFFFSPAISLILAWQSTAVQKCSSKHNEKPFHMIIFESNKTCVTWKISPSDVSGKERGWLYF